MSDDMSATRERFHAIQSVVDEFMNEHEALIEQLRDIVAERNDALDAYKAVVKQGVLEDPKRRGAVTLGDFTFTKKLSENYDPGMLVDVCPAIAQHRGVFKVLHEAEITDAGLVKEYLDDPQATVTVDKNRVNDLLNQKLVTRGEVEGAIVEKALTPSQSAGPRPYPVP